MIHHAAVRMSETSAPTPQILLRARRRSDRLGHNSPDQFGSSPDAWFPRALSGVHGYCERVSTSSESSKSGPVNNGPMNHGPINLDAIAGVPLSPSVIKAWDTAASGAFSDPARMHHAGRQAGLLLESARSSIAMSLGCNPQNVFFAGSAADGLRTAIGGIYRLRSTMSNRVLVGAVESMAVLNAVEHLPSVEIVRIDIDSVGRIDLDQFQRELAKGAALACVQVANAEVGTRQPISEVVTQARTAGIPVVSDATAVIAHDPLPSDYDVIVAPARDWGGPPGIALVVTSPHVRWRPEEAPDRGWIGGFPDIPAAVAAAVALEESREDQESPTTTRKLIHQVRISLDQLEGMTCVGDPDDRLPHIVTCVVSGAAAGELVTALDKHQIYVASGSACTADTRMPSHVLQAMGLPSESSIRISLPATCTQNQIDDFLATFPQILDSVLHS